jgi:murein DD-endopeptidase MepM/ murein hydrolase activator NlpD
MRFKWNKILSGNVYVRLSVYIVGSILVSILFYIGSPHQSSENKFSISSTLPRAAIFTAPPKAVPRPIHITGIVKRGDTIINIFKSAGLEHKTAYQLVTELKPVYDLRRIASGHKYSMSIMKRSGILKKFTYSIDLDHYLDVRQDKNSQSYKAEIVEIPYKVKQEFISGEIEYSLFASIMDGGEKPELADLMASLYEYDIDFNRDIRKKDSYAVMVEKMYLEGRFIRYGNILASQFTNRGTTIRVIRYTDPEGKTAYYHPDGRSVRKMFLRCPLPFMRVTSRYGNRRHPVLGYSAKHNGIDLGAPIGTKIRSTASGVIKSMGYQRYKGRFIAIRHKNHYVTHYYHLSRYAKGMKTGKRVEQGQIIGYVGKTGLSTGAHLHYGLQKSGRFTNPLLLNSPTKDPIPPKYMNSFKHYSRNVFLVLAGSRYMKIPPRMMDAILNPSPKQVQPKPSAQMHRLKPIMSPLVRR